nr:tRNA 2-selenouridine(34) synthase MnmH [Neobacillus sp. Marseille-Q6967]
MREITIEELQTLKNPVIIDIRAPIEFKDGSIPGAINIPLFSNEEREEIGTVYKQQGQAAAKWLAMEKVSPKIPEMLNQIKQAANGEELIVHCWRGGMRSKAVVTFLEFAGIHGRRLVGGYRAYRQNILRHIPSMYPEKAVVLHGLTGVGKTEILKRLKLEGFPILDLEDMAGHRGSMFGTIGLEDGHNQKTFDSLLYKGLKELQGWNYFIMEAESKRIGKAVQPEELVEKKRTGIHIHLHTSLENRVQHLVNEYVNPYKHQPWFFEKISNGVEKILRRIKDHELKQQIISNLENGNYPKLIEILLEHYYDPRYDHKRQEYEGEFIDIYTDTIEDAVHKILIELKKPSNEKALLI